MDIDDVIVRTGEFGLFQWKAFIGCMLVNLYCGSEMVQNIFAGAIPKNQTCLDPIASDPCSVHCNSYDYPEDNFTSYATQWGMTCDGKVQVTQSIYMAGVMTGSFFMGGLGDKFGRFPVLLVSQSLCSLIALLSSFPQSWILYAILRFFTGFFLSGIIIVSFVLTSELVGPSKRGLIGTLPGAAFSVGICILSLTAWYTQNWRTMSAALGALGLALIPFIYWWYEESPRWHLGKGNVEKCQAILQKIAKTNGHDIGDINLKVVSTSGAQADTSMISLFKNRILRKITLIQLATWFTASSVYYGLTIASGDIGEDRYSSVVYNALVEIPANLTILFVMNIRRVGRVKSCAIGMVVSSLFCGSIWFIDEAAASSKMAIVGLSCAGKFFIVMAFSTVYVQAGELYPTPVRNVGLGVVSVSSRVGGILAPQIVNFNNIYHNSHFIVFSVLGCLSGFVSLLLPESLGRPLPETPEDIYRDIKKLDNEVVHLKLGDKQKLLSDLTDDEEEMMETNT